MEMEAMMLGRILTVARERERMRKEAVEEKAGLIDGLPDVLVERSMWPCLRKVYEGISKKSQEEKEEALEFYRVLHGLNSKWRCLVTGSEEWAAYRLVNADFRDDLMNLASIRLIDQQACCQAKLSAVVEMFQGTSGVAGMSLFELRQLRSYIEREINGCSTSYSGVRGSENEF